MTKLTPSAVELRLRSSLLARINVSGLWFGERSALIASQRNHLDWASWFSVSALTAENYASNTVPASLKDAQCTLNVDQVGLSKRPGHSSTSHARPRRLVAAVEKHNHTDGDPVNTPPPAPTPWTRCYTLIIYEKLVCTVQKLSYYCPTQEHLGLNLV